MKVGERVSDSAEMMCLIRLWWSRVRKSWSQSRQCPWFDHDEDELDRCRFDRDEVFDSAMTKQSCKFLYVTTIMSLIWPRRSRVGESLIWPWWYVRFGHYEAKSVSLRVSCSVSNSVMIMLSRKVFYSAAATSLFGHDDAKYESLLLDCDNISDSATTKLSREVFNSIATASPIQSRRRPVGESLIRPRWYRVEKSCSQSRRIQSSHDKAELESLGADRDISNSAMMKMS